MHVTAANVADAIRRLLPPGSAYGGAIAGEIYNLLLGLGEEFVRVRERVVALITESDPRYTNELIPEWETEFGLPAKCISTEQTLDERRAAVLAKIVNDGGQSVQFYIDQAAALGSEIAIEEQSGFRLGVDGMGDGLGGTEWNYAWYINVIGETEQNELLECVIRELKPAHSDVLFIYEVA